MLTVLFLLSLSLKPNLAFAQGEPPAFDKRISAIANAPNPDRIEADIKKLVSFGTRHTLSDTVSTTRGIGAARRWIKAEFNRISSACGGCLEVYEQRTLVPSENNRRIDTPTVVVNVYAVLRGTKRPNHYVIMSGDIDSRISDPMNRTDDSPGANDNASGMAGVLEAARVLSAYRFENSIVLAGLSGEEQGLFGGKAMAEMAKEEGWNIIGILNNDMIGNIHGIDGVIDNRTFRIFSEPNFQDANERLRTWRRYYGGEVDGSSRQLARYVHRITQQYMPQMNPMMIYRLDRFGRGGHHKPFNNDIGGTVEPAARLEWTPNEKNDVLGYKIYYRLTTESQWTNYVWVSGDQTKHTMKGLVVDNYNFGVAAVSRTGHESLVVFPSVVLR